MPANSEKRLIISDTSCLIGLTNIGMLDVLKQLYNTVIVTREIAREYGEPLPDWILVRNVTAAIPG
jgi:predicted nucleic acid-binding protein